MAGRTESGRRRPSPLVWIGLAAAWLLPVLAAAAQVQSASVDHDGGRYHIDLKVRLDADPARAYAVFTNFSNLPRINPVVLSVDVVPDSPPYTLRLTSNMEACALVFCRKLHQVQDVRLQSDGHGGSMLADMIPSLSDFSYGQAHWDFAPCADNAQQTCMRFRAQVDPKFWIPPLVGPWLIERRLREEGVVTAKGIERLAHDDTTAAR